jgi:hypothetical protein
MQLVGERFVSWEGVTLYPEIPGWSLRFFLVDLGYDVDLHQTRLGAQDGERVGWLDTTAHQFPVHADDRAFYTATFDSSYSRQNAGIIAVWRSFLARQPAAAPADLLALVEAHPELAAIVAANAALGDPGVPRRTLLRLAMTSPEIAIRVLGLPRMQHDAPAIVAISRAPRLWTAEDVRSAADTALMPLGPALAQDRRTDEPVLFALALGGRERSTALAALMLQHPTVRHSGRILAVLALRNAGSMAAVDARERLAALGTTVPAEMVAIIGRATSERIPPETLREVLSIADPRDISVPIQRAAAALTDGAYLGVRAQGLNMLAAVGATP